MLNKLSADPTSLILSIISMVIIFLGCCCGLFALVALGLAIVALVMANKSLKEYSLNPEIYNISSKNNVFASKVISIVAICISSIFVIIWIAYYSIFGVALSTGLMEAIKNKNKYEYSTNDTVVNQDADYVDSVYFDSDTTYVDTVKVEKIK